MDSDTDELRKISEAYLGKNTPNKERKRAKRQSSEAWNFIARLRDVPAAMRDAGYSEEQIKVAMGGRGARSWMALLGLVAGATLYVYTDASFEVTGYFWLGVW